MSEFTKWDSELYHHGILGMKWGIRRFQNADGSLTPLGRKRYAKETAKLEKQAEKTRKRNERANAQRLRSAVKRPSKYTDEEIRQRIERLKLDVQYLSLLKQTSPENFAVTTGKQFIGDIEKIVAKGGMNTVQWLTERPLHERTWDLAIKSAEAVGKIATGTSGIVSGLASYKKNNTERKGLLDKLKDKKDSKEEKKLDAIIAEWQLDERKGKK